MPWNTPSLRDLRRINRDGLAGQLQAEVLPNSPARVFSDQNAAGAHLALLYIDYIANNLLPDRAEYEWLLRWAFILFNGPKSATYAEGSVLVTGDAGTLIPEGSQLFTGDGVTYQTTEDVYLAAGGSTVNVLALREGAIGNREAGDALSFSVAISGIDASARAVEITGGTDAETVEDLRTRVLLRIRETPMGGDRNDYVQWALDVPGVTRAWVAPLEMGIGTVTVRFMMDSLRASANGFPQPEDIEAVRAYLDTVRPVAIKDFFVFGPKPYPFDVTITDLSRDTPSTRVAIEKALQAMLYERAEPGGTIWASWQAEAVSGALGEDHHTGDYVNVVMPTGGHMGVLQNLVFA